MTNKKAFMILKNDPYLEQIFLLDVHSLQTTYHFSSLQARQLYEDFHRFTPRQIVSYLNRREMNPITILDPHYPPLLKNIYDPPLILYTKGKISLLQSKMFAVVGTRTPSSIGKRSMGEILPTLIKDDWTIVSGMALGIDTVAHQLALQNKGHTIAVLGSGFFHIYPQKNKHLFEEIKKDSLIVSEYPPYVSPKRWHFPARNRIISGLSHGVLIVEAKEKSGSLITADQALEQGRDVFAIPGPIYEKNFSGSNYLIQQGAKLVMQAQDIIEDLQAIY
ncbi:DNA-processing protein DprA [Alkalihalobacillus trypoxylicola]|uniref:Smf/DprA SLOG domain-containing protein n=2 Tax=Alkalihalobacillus trypoxylicola TaxID=519424 RepID=A0A161PMM1_9BACI|nr:DNA-processing protein DprA [Alkalihalobacillus trypoxylicola]KYG35333.1 hypothetical protein AZF04_01670 [Alkalihalobacillus trypoxylicola]